MPINLIDIKQTDKFCKKIFPMFDSCGGEVGAGKPN